MRQKVSFISLKLGTVVVHAKLIFLYFFRISRNKTDMGLRGATCPEGFLDFREILEIWEITRGDLPAGGDLPCRVSEKRGSREATSLALLGRWRRRWGQKKTCFKSAENWAASSLWVGGHRYTGIKFVSKLVWVYSDLKLRHHFGQFSIP